jgi:uridylate kinase
MQPRYKRVLLKISGEALAGTRGYGLEPQTCQQLAAEIRQVVDSGVQLGIVVGGGNIFRGLSDSARGMNRTAADTMGMLATVINGLALKEYFEAAGVPTVVFSANAIEKATQTFSASQAIAALEQGSTVILTGGTGNPFFTTDTAAALRCAEIEAEALLKATKVDGIYDSDPMKNPDAVKLTTLTHQQALEKDLKVMDATAFSFCMQNAIPIVVFKLAEPGNLIRCLEGQSVGSTVTRGV